jgi:hypothetical protein
MACRPNIGFDGGRAGMDHVASGTPGSKHSCAESRASRSCRLVPDFGRDALQRHAVRRFVGFNDSALPGICPHRRD